MKAIERIYNFFYRQTEKPNGIYRVVRHRNGKFYPMVKGLFFWYELFTYSGDEVETPHVSVMNQPEWLDVCGMTSIEQAQRFIDLHHEQCLEAAEYQTTPEWTLISRTIFTNQDGLVIDES